MKTRASLAEFLSPELRPYLTYSLAVHVALAAVAARMLAGSVPGSKNTVYTIDFVGPSATTITSAAPSEAAKPAAAAAAARPAPQTEYDEFGRRKGRSHFELPRPSLLRGVSAKPEPAPAPPAATNSQAPAPAAAAGSSGGGAEASADMPNFPYPWYISRVRQSLWNQWSGRMPKQAGECVVVFSLLPNGGVVDLRTETSSGDAAFDLTALSAVQDAAPYPPLPRGFTEPFLKIHVTLRSQ